LCHAVLSLQFTHVRFFVCRQKRSQEGPRGATSPTNFYTYSHWCFERRYHKQNSVIRLKSNILSPTKFFGPSKLLGCLRYGLHGQVAKRASGLFYCWSLSCNNNITTNFKCSLQVTISGVLSHVTLERRHFGR